MVFDIPKLPITLTIGREKQQVTPPQAESLVKLDSKDLAIFFLCVALLFTTLAVVSLAAGR